MGPVGWQEMVIIFIVALVLFGPKKLPELGRMLGKAITEFRRASNELRSTFEREMQNLERETESVKEVSRSSYSSEVQNSYDSSYGDYSYDSGAYGSETYDSTATNPTTVGGSAVQDAESKAVETAVKPAGHVEGTVARNTGAESASPEAELAKPESQTA